MGAPVGCTSRTRMSCATSTRPWRNESRVRKKFPLTRYCPDANGKPALGVVNVQGWGDAERLLVGHRGQRVGGVGARAAPSRRGGGGRSGGGARGPRPPVGPT